MKTPKASKPLANVIPNDSVAALEKQVAEKKQKELQQRADKFMAEFMPLKEKYNIDFMAVPITQVAEDGTLKIGCRMQLVDITKNA